MSNFIKHVNHLIDELDDIIIYMENSGKSNGLLYQVREELEDDDPFIKINAYVTAQILILQNRVIH